MKTYRARIIIESYDTAVDVGDQWFCTSSESLPEVTSIHIAEAIAEAAFQAARDKFEGVTS